MSVAEVTVVRKLVAPKEIVSQRETAAQMVIVAPKAAVPTENGVREEIAIQKPVVPMGIVQLKADARKVIDDQRHEVQKGAAPMETVVRTDRADRCSFANSTRTTTAASRRTSWPSWRTYSMN